MRSVTLRSSVSYVERVHTFASGDYLPTVDSMCYESAGIQYSIVVLLTMWRAGALIVNSNGKCRFIFLKGLLMNKNVLISVVCFLTAFLTSAQALAITVEELADICEAMEKNIQDIYIEFERRFDPPPDINEMPTSNSFMSKGPEKVTWATKRPFGQFSLSTQEVTLVNRYGDYHNSTIKQSYNGKIAKRFQKSSGGQFRNDRLEGFVTRRNKLVYDMQHTPAGFSILHFSLREAAGRKPLSEFLRDNKEVISLDDNIVKINGFNAIKIDILHKIAKVLWGTVYFSVEHGYTPVRYEYWSGGLKRLIVRHNVTSLEKISDGLWFPKSAYSEWPDGDGDIIFYTATKISLNQGLGDEYFDFEFPPGTKVYDETVISSDSDTLQESVNSQQQANIQKPKNTMLIYGSIVLVAAILLTILAVRLR